MSTLILSQQVGDKCGFTTDAKGGLLGGDSSVGGEPTKALERKRAGSCESPSNYSLEAITERATAITPLLAEILTHKAAPTLGNVE